MNGLLGLGDCLPPFFTCVLSSSRRRSCDVSDVLVGEFAEVGDWPEVCQFVRACDLIAGDIERAHADQPLLSIEKERSRAAVDLDEAQRRARNAGGQAEVVDERARDTVAPGQRPRERRSLAAPPRVSTTS
jgi:hypothetical protein